MEIGYKVIKPSRWSAISNNHKGNVKYIIDKITIPNKGCGPLCVFSTREAADKFNRVDGIYPIGSTVRCQYKQSAKVHVWDTSLTKMPLDILPLGTVLADSVTCLE